MIVNVTSYTPYNQKSDWTVINNDVMITIEVIR